MYFKPNVHVKHQISIPMQCTVYIITYSVVTNVLFFHLYPKLTHNWLARCKEYSVWSLEDEPQLRPFSTSPWSGRLHSIREFFCKKELQVSLARKQELGCTKQHIQSRADCGASVASPGSHRGGAEAEILFCQTGMLMKPEPHSLTAPWYTELSEGHCPSDSSKVT